MGKSVRKVVLASLMMSFAASGAFAQALQNVELHGYMQNRFYANPDSTARFITERISLSAAAKIAEDKNAYVEVYFNPAVTDRVLGTAPNQYTGEQGRTYIESAYMDMPFAKGRLRVGKGRGLNFGMTPSYPNRKLTNYNILAETFTQDRITGVQYAYKQDDFDFGASLYNDLRLGTRNIGYVSGLNSNPVIPHFAERDDTANVSGRLAISTRFGWTGPCTKLHFSGMIGGLAQEDANKVAAAYNGLGATATDRDHSKYGVDLAFAKGTFVSSVEAYQGKYSFLTISGYSVMVGYEPKNSRRVYARYSALNNDQAPVAASAQTWNTQQLQLGIVQPIAKSVWAEVNYEKNTESPAAGGASVDNNVLFLEFFTGF